MGEDNNVGSEKVGNSIGGNQIVPHSYPLLFNLEEKTKHLSSQKEPMCDFGQSSGICQGMSHLRKGKALYSFSWLLVEENILRVMSCSIFTFGEKNQVCKALTERKKERKKRTSGFWVMILCALPFSVSHYARQTRVNVKRFIMKKKLLVKKTENDLSHFICHNTW